MIPENNLYASQTDIFLHRKPCLSVVQISRALDWPIDDIEKVYNFVITGIKVPLFDFSGNIT